MTCDHVGGGRLVVDQEDHVVLSRDAMTDKSRRDLRCFAIIERLFQTEKPSDVLREPVINFNMSWDWLFLARCRIAVDVMLSAVTMQNTPCGHQCANKLATLQTAISFVE